MFQALNCEVLNMLYTSARKRITRFSLFRGNFLVRVTSKFITCVSGIFTMLPAPALPKHSMFSPMPSCGVAAGVALHGYGIWNALILSSWLPGVPLGPYPNAAGLPWLVDTAAPPTNEAWPADKFGFPTT